MNELKPCPFCGGKVRIDMLDCENSRNVKIYSVVHCPECYQWFFKGLSRDITVERWNRRAEPENKPLALEELACMHGEPIYIIEKGIAPVNRWEILDEDTPVDWNLHDVNLKCGDAYPTGTCGKTWLAYRYKPKEAQQHD